MTLQYSGSPKNSTRGTSSSLPPPPPPADSYPSSLFVGFPSLSKGILPQSGPCSQGLSSENEVDWEQVAWWIPAQSIDEWEVVGCLKTPLKPFTGGAFVWDFSGKDGMVFMFCFWADSAVFRTNKIAFRLFRPWLQNKRNTVYSR